DLLRPAYGRGEQTGAAPRTANILLLLEDEVVSPYPINRIAAGEHNMSDDSRNFIERAESITGNLYGEPMSVERIAENFALYGLKKRVAALEKFDAELQGEIDSSPHSLRKRVQLVDLRRRMGSLHEALRKAKR
ncbi:MAG: hypothetical protein AB1745_19105, partial [Pseudomonadota bacterium]